MTEIKLFEQSSLMFQKLIDGLAFPKNPDTVVFDASFSDFIVPEYLFNYYGYRKIFTISDRNYSDNESILSVPFRGDFLKTIMGHKVDLFISIGSYFGISPVFDAVHAINRVLVAGGKFVITLYPDIFDEQGRDILNGLSLISEIPVKEKFLRWGTTFKNALKNIFMKVDEEDVLTKMEVSHIIDLFNMDTYRRFLFRDEAERERFFKPISHLNIDYNISWKVVKGFKC
ncbi:MULTISPECIES: hypothetical protein [Calditerrivibrio]|uniref:hypothetical protein n=1 Tax=Calditerrivibrio TaxID=545865 RepID=UPI003C75CCD2